MAIFRKFGHKLNRAFGKHSNLARAFSKGGDIEKGLTKAGNFLEGQGANILDTTADVAAGLGGVAAATGLGLPLAGALEGASAGLHSGADAARAEGRAIHSVRGNVLDARNTLKENARIAQQDAKNRAAATPSRLSGGIQAIKPKALEPSVSFE